MADLREMERKVLELLEGLEEKGLDAASAYEQAAAEANKLADPGGNEMKKLMVMIEDWIAENY